MNFENKDKTHYGKEYQFSNKWHQTRNKIEDLYKSEKYFFLPIIKKSFSFLDLGCASGGFYNILRNKKKTFSYIGFDISQNMITAAQKKFKKGKFKIYNGKKINLKKNTLETCFSFGTLHHTQNYLQLIKQMMKISRKYIIFDMRFTYSRSLVNCKNSYQSFFYSNNKCSKIQYNVINIKSFLKELKKITKKYSIQIYGYKHSPNKTVKTKYTKVITAAVLIDKTCNKNLKINIKI